MSAFFCKITHKSAKLGEKSAKLCITIKNSVILLGLVTFYCAVIQTLVIFCWYKKCLKCACIVNSYVILSPLQISTFFAFSWLENFLRNKSVILNICTVNINKINSYRVQASCPDSFFGEKVVLYSVMIFRFTKIFLTNLIFWIYYWINIKI